MRSVDVHDGRLVEVCQHVIGEADRAGLRAALPAIQAELAETLRFRGRWHEADMYARAGAAKRIRNHPIILAQLRMDEALLDGDPDVARDAIRLARLGPVFPNQVDALIAGGEVLATNGARERGRRIPA